jgi:Flp pilus assembly pilin Flp
MKRLLARFLLNSSGSTAIEYTMMASGISLAIMLSAAHLGPRVNASFNAVGMHLSCTPGFLRDR